MASNPIIVQGIRFLRLYLGKQWKYRIKFAISLPSLRDGGIESEWNEIETGQDGSEFNIYHYDGGVDIRPYCWYDIHLSIEYPTKCREVIHVSRELHDASCILNYV
jgi:hypothetical protein